MLVITFMHLYVLNHTCDYDTHTQDTCSKTEEAEASATPTLYWAQPTKTYRPAYSNLPYRFEAPKPEDKKQEKEVDLEFLEVSAHSRASLSSQSLAPSSNSSTVCILD